jgi:O-antigen ligase
MEERAKKGSNFFLFVQFLYLVFFVSLFFSFRAITSISVGLLLLATLAGNWNKFSLPGLRSPYGLFFWSLVLYFLLQLLALSYTPTNPGTWKDIQLKSALVFLPLTVYYTGLNPGNSRKLIQAYCILLAITMGYCLVRAALHFFETGDGNVFYYYSFSGLIRQHPVYLSIYLFVGIMFLLEGMNSKTNSFNHPAVISMIILFSVCLYLLSSKLVISFYLLCLIFLFIALIRQSRLRRYVYITALGVFLVGLGLLLFTKNPVSSRFRDVVPRDISLIHKEQFSPGDYFNGIEFRLLQWKLVPAILSENNAWLTGVGVSEAQPLLDKQYLSRNMYAGDPIAGTKGYPGYNTHNQFLESLLKHGIPGLALFIGICFALMLIARSIKTWAGRFVIILLLLYALVESVLETQYGIVLFSFLPGFMYYCRRE